MRHLCVLNGQLGAREDCVETAVDIAPKRDNMLQQLLTILNTDSLPQPLDDGMPLSVLSSQYLCLHFCCCLDVCLPPVTVRIFCLCLVF